jgi:hypothetical protein
MLEKTNIPPINFMDKGSLKAVQELFTIFVKHWKIEKAQLQMFINLYFFAFVGLMIWFMNIYYGDDTPMQKEKERIMISNLSYMYII